MAKILIADHNPSRIMGVVLEGNYDVEFVSDADEVVPTTLEFRPDLVILNEGKLERFNSGG